MKPKMLAVTLMVIVGGLGVGVGLSTLGAFSSANSRPGIAAHLAASATSGQAEALDLGVGTAAPPQLSDLIPVRATNGDMGYVTRADLLGPSPTLQQVLAYARDSSGNLVAPVASTTLPVFASDGVTQIGVFAETGTHTSTDTTSP